MRRLAVLSLAAALVSGNAGLALGQTQTSYPASNAPGDLAAWLKRETPIAPNQVVDIAASAATAVVSSQPTTDPKGFIAILHAEALDPGIEAEEGIVSWTIPVELDCPRHKVRLGQMTGFPSRDIHTSPKPIREPDADWVIPSPRAPLDSVLKSLCDPRFKRPLADVKVAAEPAPKPVAAAAAAALKPAPAAPAPVQVAQQAAPVPAPAPAPVPRQPAPEPRKATPPPGPASAPASAPAGSVSAAVQIGASPVQAEIKAMLAKVEKKFGGELKGRKSDAVAVTLDGKTVYRGLITGFHSASEATSLCETLKAGGQACFVRK